MLGKFDNALNVMIDQNISNEDGAIFKEIRIYLDLCLDSKFTDVLTNKLCEYLRNNKEITKVNIRIRCIGIDSKKILENDEKLIKLMKDNRHIKEIIIDYIQFYK